MDNSEVIRFVELLLVTIPLLAYLSKVKTVDKPIHWLGGLFLIASVLDVTAYILYNRRIHTIWVFNTYFVLYFVMLSIFYYKTAFKKKGWTGIIVIGTAFYAIFYLMTTIFVQPFDTYQGLTWTTGNIILLVYSIFFFLYIREFETVRFNGLSFINYAVFLYSLLTLLLFTAAEAALTHENKELARFIWSLHNITSILKSTLFAIGVYLSSK